MDGGGIYAGIIKLDDYEKIITENHISKAYGLGKNVLFLSTSFLFFILYLSRKANKEYLWFGLFLVVISIYEFCRLELKNNLGLDLIILKYIEYLVLIFVILILTSHVSCLILTMTLIFKFY